MKKLISILLLCSAALMFASEYKIKDTEYDITGKTREYPLRTKVPVDYNRIFKDEDELIAYIEDFKQQLENTRNFETVDVDFLVSNPDENDLCEVVLKVTTVDSFHIIATPYPKYTSGDSFNLMIKAKDTNFFGSMETMNAESKFQIKLDDNDKPKDYLLGVGLSFDTPFQAGKLDAVWGNDFDFSYTFGDSTPEWKIDSNLQFTKNFKNFSVITKFSQIFSRNLDYEEEDINGTIVKYGDGTYFGEVVNLSIPIIIQKVPNWGNIYYTPFCAGTYYWDFDGISKENSYLRGPVMTFGQSLSTGRVNWEGNFRTGLVSSITNSYGYDFATYQFIPSFTAEIKAYKAFDRVALCTDWYAFAVMNGTMNFGDRLRGIRPKQYFNKKSGHQMEKACDSSAALVVNVDMPIRLFTIYWEQVPLIKKMKKCYYFNMEAQLSPFIDVALFHNEAAGTAFNPKDGFLAGGLEGIIYPLKWKGIQIRGSLGVDLSRKMPKIKRKFNQSWRSNVKAYEIQIGIGLHY